MTLLLKRAGLCLVGAALPLTACSNGQLTRPQGPPSLSTAPEVEAATVSIDCADPNTLAAPLAALASVGVSFGVDLVGKILADRQAKRNAIWSASGIAEDCMPAKSGAAKKGVLAIRRAVLDSTGKPIGTPGFLLTGDLVLERTALDPKDSSKDRVTVSFTPTQFDYGRTAARTRGSGRKHVIVLLSLSDKPVLKAKEATGEEDLPLALRIDLGTLADSYTYTNGMLKQGKATLR